MTIFGLFLFVLILCISGMAVDLIRHENDRVAIQNVVDSAILAASSMHSSAETNAEATALVKEYVQKAGINPDRVNVTPNIESANGNVTSKSVSASIDFDMNTMFMNMMGVQSLPIRTYSSATEVDQILEIVMVLDISGSMGNNGKLENLQTAAKEFVRKIIERNGTERVMISIVPYNQQVYMGDDLMARLTDTTVSDFIMNDPLTTVTLPNPAPYPNMISQYNYRTANSRCARFEDADFGTRTLAAGSLNTAGDADSAASFSPNDYVWGLNGNFNAEFAEPQNHTYWCGDYFPSILLYENDIDTLHTHIDSFEAYGWTAIDYGMNWAVGLLDPSFEPIINDMATAPTPLVAAAAEGHPVDFGTKNVAKYIILMTDGANTHQFDLKPAYKAGPSRVWYSDARVAANANEYYQGFLVEMPNNPANQRFYAPGSPWDTTDDTFVSVTEMNSTFDDATQWSHPQVYRRFQTDDAARYFFENSGDAAAFTEYMDVLDDIGGYGEADTDLKAVCDQAKDQDYIEVFSVAFEAPPAGDAVLSYCASKPGNYFDVNGAEIQSAFDAIAAQISQLRLTE